MKRIILSFLLFILLFISAQQVFALEDTSSNQLKVILFYGEGCPHCKAAINFLEKTIPLYPQVTFEQYEIYNNQFNQIKMQATVKKLRVKSSGVPLILVGDSYFSGYSTDDISGKNIQEEIEKQLVSQIDQNLQEKNEDENINRAINLPIVGEIKVEHFSLPILTILIAVIDGFNPCAMWTLLFLISLLFGMKDRKRMWILGISFIVASATVYFLFLAAWLSLFSFLGVVSWIKIVIGLLAIGAGSYYLRDVVVNKSGGCQVTNNERRTKILEQLKKFTQEKQLILALVGIVVLAFAVNLIELVCSAGLPAIYTQILSMSDLSIWQYYGYLILYVLIFMLDDIFVFMTAMITLKAIGIESKYARYSHLIGGVLLLIIGLLLLFKPEWLMFA